MTLDLIMLLQWRHNERDGVSNHQPHDCLLHRLFRRRSKKYESSASLAFVWGIHRGPVNSPHKWLVTRKMSPFHDVIMFRSNHVIWFVLPIVQTSFPQCAGSEFIRFNIVNITVVDVRLAPCVARTSWYWLCKISVSFQLPVPSQCGGMA